VDYHRDLADQVRRIAPAGVDAVVQSAGQPAMMSHANKRLAIVACSESGAA
jgi:hypothetical protein